MLEMARFCMGIWATLSLSTEYALRGLKIFFVDKVVVGHLCELKFKRVGRKSL